MRLALLGDEALALGAVHAGISAAYGYPGTPSTEIMEYLQKQAADAGGAFTAKWCVNEKTALEAALGVSFAGRRSLVTMKHVGLNVASDPFVNAALLDINGGLVVAVADDPGMHSSQGEQDSRFYAAFALVPCLEPRSQQEAYDMCREAFAVSEKFRVPVLIRLVTRLSHARSSIAAREAERPKPCAKSGGRSGWMLLPAFARKNYAALIEKQKGFAAWSEEHAAKNTSGGADVSGGKNTAGNAGSRDSADGVPFAVITSGLGGNYYEENLDDLSARLGAAPPRLHIEAYPLPAAPIRALCEKTENILVVEEGQPFIEERLRGILPQRVQVLGRFEALPGGEKVPRTGELDPDNVRAALGLPKRKTVLDALPADGAAAVFAEGKTGRPPQLCQGCPHADSYETINRAAAEIDPRPNHPSICVNSDIGCYSLGASPPYSAIESIVCMGASIGMARGAADAGIPYALAVLGDSTFIHSGITALIDAVRTNSPITVCILDNSTVAMTGCQATAIPSENLKALILGTGIDPAHCLELDTRRQNIEENTVRLKKELEYRGISTVVFRRECLEAARKRLKAAGKAKPA